MRWPALALLALCACGARVPDREPDREPIVDWNEHFLAQSDQFVWLAHGREICVSRELARAMVNDSRWEFVETAGVPANQAIVKAYRW